MNERVQLLPTGRRPPYIRTGFTLLELVAVVALLGLALAEAVPTARRLADRMAVVGAREELVGLFHRVRAEALARGEASVTLVASPPGAQLWSGGLLKAEVDLSRSYGVEMALSRDRDRAELFFDAMGLGRVSSQSIRISRGGEEAGLVISSTGRVTRR